MKSLLLLVTTMLLMSSLLYPLFITGIGREIWWPLEGGCLAGGLFGYYLLVRYRRQL